ncbi:MAG: hypothetical protein JWP97_29 [Labilithrix sp.]|nr:hypothetical protein [Labilithrix sp.]
MGFRVSTSWLFRGATSATPHGAGGAGGVAVRAGLAAALVALLAGATDCYATGDGTAPPLQSFYFPVGLKVSSGGSVLYVANSDFDLQYNGGTLQSYDLSAIRQDVVKLIADPTTTGIPLDDPSAPRGVCPGRDPGTTLGETCAPPTRSEVYVRDSAVIGAFATDLLLSDPPASLEPAVLGEAAGNRAYDRLFAAVRGNASVTWASVERDAPQSGTATGVRPATYGPFVIQCGQDGERRCDGRHEAGNNTDEQGNTRHISMPGEPFGMAFSSDGASLVVTHQSETRVSLFDTGLRRADTGSDPALAPPPSLQFVLDGVPTGGVGVANVPHDRDAFTGTGIAFPRPAFLMTSRLVANVTLLREYSDQFNGAESNQLRPFLNYENGAPINVGPSGVDSRGIAIDPTPRIACKARVQAHPADPASGRTQQVVEEELRACARKPARVYIANRAPASLLIGDLGVSSTDTVPYDADQLQIRKSLPLSAGPSKVFLAPVVEADGALALRVFVVCFDSATLFVFNPDTEELENVVRVGLGPFSMAFDPFSLEDVALHKVVDPVNGIRPYRFAYLASFTNSFIQILDLDNAGRSASFERIVYTLGRPTTPKGS